MTEKDSTSSAKTASDPIVNRVGEREKLRQAEEAKSKKRAKRTDRPRSTKGTGKRG